MYTNQSRDRVLFESIEIPDIQGYEVNGVQDAKHLQLVVEPGAEKVVYFKQTDFDCYLGGLAYSFKVGGGIPQSGRHPYNYDLGHMGL